MRKKWYHCVDVKIFLNKYSNNNIKKITFFLSRIDPRPKTAILHIVSSCNRRNEFPLGPNSFPTKLNWKIIWNLLSIYYALSFLILHTLGWSRTGTATLTQILIGLSRVISIILLFSCMWGIDKGEPINKRRKLIRNDNHTLVFHVFFIFYGFHWSLVFDLEHIIKYDVEKH